MTRLLLRKSDVLKAYDGVARRAALDLDISAQAVSSWGTYLPELMAYKVLELKPELREKARHAKTKRRTTPPRSTAPRTIPAA